MGTNVILRVSEEEKELWVEVAGKRGLSAWIRSVCNDACYDDMDDQSFEEVVCIPCED